MGDPSDSDAWHEALAAEKKGDVAPLAALLLCAVPLQFHEQIRARLFSQRRRGPSDHDRRIARAVRDIENATPAGIAYSNAILSSACAAAAVSPQAVANYMEKRNRQGVTIALEELGHRQRRGYHRTKFLP